MKRRVFLISLTVIGTILSIGSYIAQQQVKNLHILNAQWKNEQETHHLLQAEYTYLINPIRLKKIQEKYFPTYQTVTAAQIKRLPALTK